MSQVMVGRPAVQRLRCRDPIPELGGVALERIGHIIWLGVAGGDAPEQVQDLELLVAQRGHPACVH